MINDIYNFTTEIIEENNLPENYVDDINDCFYILPFGEFLGYHGEYGSRYTDHRDIILPSMGVKDQKELCIKYNLIQYVKEYPCAIVWEGQSLTVEQLDILESLNIEIQYEK